MFRRKKRYKAKFWCNNCGDDFTMKLPMGVMPTQHEDLYYLYDVHKQINVDSNGKLTKEPIFAFCTKCGSYEISQVKWTVKKNE